MVPIWWGILVASWLSFIWKPYTLLTSFSFVKKTSLNFVNNYFACARSPVQSPERSILTLCWLFFLVVEKMNNLAARKCSKHGVFSSPYVLAFGVSLRIQSKCGKIRNRKSSVFGYFSCSVWMIRRFHWKISVFWVLYASLLVFLDIVMTRWLRFSAMLFTGAFSISLFFFVFWCSDDSLTLKFDTKVIYFRQPTVFQSDIVSCLVGYKGLKVALCSFLECYK